MLHRDNPEVPVGEWIYGLNAMVDAGKKGTGTINIVGAYALQQAFPQFALVGPRNLQELHDTLKTPNVELTPEEVAWLDLREV